MVLPDIAQVHRSIWLARAWHGAQLSSSEHETWSSEWRWHAVAVADTGQALERTTEDLASFKCRFPTSPCASLASVLLKTHMTHMICSIVNTSEETTAGNAWCEVVNRTMHIRQAYQIT